MRIRSLNLSTTDWEKAQKQSKQQGISLSFVVRVLIRMWLEGKITLDLNCAPGSDE